MWGYGGQISRAFESRRRPLYAQASYALGLLAQIGFGLMPLIQMRLVEKP